MSELSRISRVAPAILSCALPALLIAGCSDGRQADEQSAQADLAPAATVEARSPGIAQPDAATPEPAAGASGIPAIAHGRWGLVPADCTSTRGDAKGLLVVDATSLKFYESVARLGEVKERDANGIRAVFAQTGEGMEWTREMGLDVQPGGKTLVRREYGPDALKGPQDYAKCGDDD